jgi:hypothetical protein
MQSFRGFDLFSPARPWWLLLRVPRKNKKASLGPCLDPTELAFAQARFPANDIGWFFRQVEAKQCLTVSFREPCKNLLDDSCVFRLHSTPRPR